MKVNATVPYAERLKTLPELAADVRAARRIVHARRIAPVIVGDLVMARHALLQAMEAYASELATRHLPIPYQLRDDLRLARESAQMTGWPRER